MNQNKISTVLCALLDADTQLATQKEAVFTLLEIKPSQAPYPLVNVLQSLDTHQQDLLFLRALLLSLRLRSQNMEIFCSKLGNLSSQQRIQAKVFLNTYLTDKSALTPAIKEFLHPPTFLEKILQLLKPNQLKSLAHISPLRYRHQADIEATQKIDQSYPFDGLARFLSKHLAEKALSIQNNANAIAVNAQQFPQLHQRFTEIAHRIGVHPVPQLYISSGSINAYTAGVEQTFVVIQEGSISKLSQAELDFVIGHELGHVKFEHVLYQMIAQLAIAQGFIMSPNALIGRLIGMGMSLSIKEWARKAELSCDRAGLLACQDPKAAIKVMLRFAGVPSNELDDFNVEAYLKQHDTYTQEKASGTGRLFQGLDRSHPFLLERIQALRDFIQEDYPTILAEGVIEEDLHNFRNTGALSLFPLPPRIKLALHNQIKPQDWIITSQSKAGTHLRNTLSIPTNIAALHESPPILSGDRVLYVLHANAFLSLRDQKNIQKLLQRSDISVALCVVGFEDIDDELDDGNPQEELKERLETYIDLQKTPVYWTDEELQHWPDTPYPQPHKGEALHTMFTYIASLPPPPKDWESNVNEEIQQKLDRFIEGIEHLKSTTKQQSAKEESFDMQSHVHQLIQKVEALWTKSNLEAPQRHFSQPQLSRRTPISKLQIASAIGSIGFGALVLPTLPIWAITTGLSIGATSILTGKWEQKNQQDRLQNLHLEEIAQWLNGVIENAKAIVRTLRSSLDSALEKIETEGWSAYIQEIAVLQKADGNKIG